MTFRLIRLGDAVSQLANVLIFNGDPNYSMSGDAYRYKRKRFEKFVNFIFSPFEKDHCRKAYENDVAKAYKLLKEAGE